MRRSVPVHMSKANSLDPPVPTETTNRGRRTPPVLGGTIKPWRKQSRRWPRPAQAHRPATARPDRSARRGLPGAVVGTVFGAVFGTAPGAGRRIRVRPPRSFSTVLLYGEYRYT